MVDCLFGMGKSLVKIVLIIVNFYYGICKWGKVFEVLFFENSWI